MAERRASRDGTPISGHTPRLDYPLAPMDPAQIVVVFGGASGERRVSVASAQHIVERLDGVHAWFVSPEGRVFTEVAPALRAHARPFEVDFAPASEPAFGSLESALDAPSSRSRAFILGFHGGAGEDGTVQRAFEARRLAFTGSGSAASARAFDKRIAKDCVAAAGVPVADAVLIDTNDSSHAARALSALLERHGRVVAKPVADGSSVGLFHVLDANDVPAAAEAIATGGKAYLAEQFIAGAELTVGVVDAGNGPRALCASEVRLAPGRAFDFEGKYLGKGTVEITPAEVPEPVSRAAMAIALASHVALGCEGYSRTDVIAAASGPVFLETNTLPGLTKASFLPQQLEVVGVSMRTFLEQQLALAVRRRDG